MRILLSIVLCLHLLAPIAAHAQVAVRSPLHVPLAEYGLMLGVAILGGLVSWIRKVRAGELAPWSLSQLIGEMVIAAFAGLLTFWACDWAGLPTTVTACLTGISGMAGSKGLVLAEQAAEMWFKRRAGLRK